MEAIVIYGELVSANTSADDGIIIDGVRFDRIVEKIQLRHRIVEPSDAEKVPKNVSVNHFVDVLVFVHQANIIRNSHLQSIAVIKYWREIRSFFLLDLYVFIVELDGERRNAKL